MKIRFILAELLLTHFSAIMGYGFWFVMIAFLATVEGHRFDLLVNNMVPAWGSSVATYISLRVLGQRPGIPTGSIKD